MRISVNGESREIESDATILDLIGSLNLRPGALIVERNGYIVDRAAFGATALGEDDVIELVHMVGGG